ncbi:MAG: hypothetical protein RL404_2705 [Pseudomonadota bacterium]|jgi:hypothetical protein
MLTTKFASRQLATAAFAALLATASGAWAEDAFKCMEETQEKCDFENENMRLFIQGRDAFEVAMESGDFSETRAIGQKLAERKNKYGNRLLKMVYVQVGFGKHKNFVQAWHWLDDEMKAGHGFARLDLEKTQAKLEALMTPEQLAEARKGK